MATIGLQHGLDPGPEGLAVLTMKSTDISAHSFSTAAFRASTLAWGMLQAFLSTTPQMP
ncbi:Uncharacterized protein FKW44_018031 [Caligus rogercresseyi]|uniref:Uncharacterized protein n=1 Tax=Caligus rogercresseyi TaxID=217165 RepID=A0A7T8GUD6_CALRO|nr:Uncharacterized protein FKW44_018031 [Caligus rogercresseyi]